METKRIIEIMINTYLEKREGLEDKMMIKFYYDNYGEDLTSLDLIDLRIEEEWKLEEAIIILKDYPNIKKILIGRLRDPENIADYITKMFNETFYEQSEEKSITNCYYTETLRALSSAIRVNEMKEWKERFLLRLFNTGDLEVLNGKIIIFGGGLRKVDNFFEEVFGLKVMRGTELRNNKRIIKGNKTRENLKRK